MLTLTGGLVLTKSLELQKLDVIVKNGFIDAFMPANSSLVERGDFLDCTGQILVPGLINAHTHSGCNLVRSWTDRWTLELQLSGGAALRGSPPVEDKYTAALLGASEMISRGCTACYDLFYEFPIPTVEGVLAVAKAYAESGMRAVIAPMIADTSFYQSIPGLIEALPADTRAELARTAMAPWKSVSDVLREALRRWPYDHAQVTLALAPTIPMHCTDEYWKQAAAFCRETGISMHTHLAESKPQAVNGLKRYGKSITAHLMDMGVLSERFTGAHCVWVDDDDVRRLADCGCAVAHCPCSNMRLGNGIAATSRMLDRKLTVGVGTDSRLCSDNLNMFEAMRIAALASRVQGTDRDSWLSSHDTFRMATLGSAQALGLKNIGSLEPGRHADILFLDATNPNYVPLNNIVNQLVYAEDATGIVSVMIGGRMVYSNGSFEAFDRIKLVSSAEDAARRLKVATEEARQSSSRLEPFVASFCGGMASAPYPINRYSAGDKG